MLKGGMTEEGMQMAMDANARLEQGIEHLRQKYAAQAEMQEKQDKINERIAEVNEALCAQACAEKERLNPTVDMTMEDADLEALRQERMNALKTRAAAAKRHVEQGGGEYREIQEEDFLKEVTAHNVVVVHFFHEEFMSCKVMDKHLRIIAPRAVGARFLRLNATKASFFTAKLKVKVLPTLVFFRDGVATGRQTGFEGLVSSATDEDFPTSKLLKHLSIAGVLGDKAAAAAAEKDGDDDSDVDDDENSFGGVGGMDEKLKLARQAMARNAIIDE